MKSLLSEKESESEFSKCALCLKCFSSEANLIRHSKTCRGRGLFSCDLCGTHASSLSMFTSHIETEHKMRNNKFLKVNSFNPENMRSSKKYKKSGTRNSANKEKGKTYHFLIKTYAAKPLCSSKNILTIKHKRFFETPNSGGRG